jgi:hypothetical protein
MLKAAATQAETDAQVHEDEGIGAFQLPMLQRRRVVVAMWSNVQVCTSIWPIHRGISSTGGHDDEPAISRGPLRQTQRRSARNDQSSVDIQARTAELRSLPQEKLADAVFLLSMAAKQQSEEIRRSIVERAGAKVEFDPPPRGDLAAYLAEEATSFLRHHETEVPSFLDILAGRPRDVDFTVEQADAVAMLAAMIREQRLEGILEGLRLAGFLNKSSKHRPDDLRS